ncbi:MAG: PEP-CTERM sorting domain-containing protein [Phycisphaerales bacterium]|nr:PEP-CTERM sorting domain-containing protein [Phycisphaerales bacterium]
MLRSKVLTIGLMAVAAAAVPTAVRAAVTTTQFNWVGTGNDNEWWDGLNWNPSGPPAAAVSGSTYTIANVGLAAPSAEPTVNIDSNAGYSGYPSGGGYVNEVWAGNGNAPGNIVMATGTTLAVNNWFVIGRMYGYAGGAITAANNASSFTMNGTAKLSDAGYVQIGGAAGNGASSGTLTMNDSSSMTVGKSFVTGNWGGTPASVSNVNINGTASLTVTGGPVVFAGDASNTTTVTQTGGTVQMGSATATGAYFDIANNGTATYTISAGSLNSYDAYGFNVGDGSGNGTLNVSGTGTVLANAMFLGKYNSAQGTVNQSGGTVNVTDPNGGTRGGYDGDVMVGYNTKTNVGTYNLTGGTLNVKNGLMVWNGQGQINISQNTSTLTKVNGNWMTLGQNNGANGTVTQTGGTVALSNYIYLGYGGGATGTYKMQGGSLSAVELRTDSGTGTFTQTAGSVSLTGNLLMSINGGSTTTYNMQGGTLSLTDIQGVFAASNFIQTGGTVTSTAGWLRLGLNGGTGSGTSTATFSGGSTSFSLNADVGESGTGILNVDTGGSLTVGGQFYIDGAAFANNLNGTGTVNLNGGTLNVKQILTNSTGGSSTFHFNGGTLVAGAASTTFMQGLTSTYVDSGGAIINTNGNNITIGQNLLAGTGNGGLDKQGAGTLELSGAGNTYTGNTLVEAGTLQIDSAFLASTSAVTVDTSALMNLNYSGNDIISALTLGGTVLGPGTYNSVNEGTFLAGTGSLQILGSNVPEPASLGMLAVGGAAILLLRRRKSA